MIKKRSAIYWYFEYHWGIYFRKAFFSLWPISSACLHCFESTHFLHTFRLGSLSQLDQKHYEVHHLCGFYYCGSHYRNFWLEYMQVEDFCVRREPPTFPLRKVLKSAQGGILYALMPWNSVKVRQSRNVSFKPTILPNEQSNSSSFVSIDILKNSRIEKSPFEINWPLGRTS